MTSYSIGQDPEGLDLLHPFPVNQDNVHTDTDLDYFLLDPNGVYLRSIFLVKCVAKFLALSQ